MMFSFQMILTESVNLNLPFEDTKAVLLNLITYLRLAGVISIFINVLNLMNIDEYRNNNHEEPNSIFYSAKATLNCLRH